MNEPRKKYLRIPNRRFKITKRMIEDAIENTKSNSEAARWLSVSFTTYKKYAIMWNLYENHKNQAGKGVNKTSRNHSISLDEILSNQVVDYSDKLLKKRLIDEGYMEEQCSLCGYNEKRIVDNKLCLFLDKIDNNVNNYSFDNLRLLCPNCYFTNVGDFKNSKKFC
jgi:hypothetical protein